MSYQPDYKYIPPAGSHALTILYDFFCRIFGLGKKFRRGILVGVPIKNSDTILDVGCGTGVFLEVIKEKYPNVQVVGVDPDVRALQIAQKRLHKYSNVTLHQSFAESLPIKDETMDICFSTLALHHMPDDTKREAIKEMYRVLKNGGRVVITDFGKTESRLIRKLLFFEKVEYLEGNFKGIILEYLNESGFQGSRVGRIKFPAINTIIAKK